MDEQFGKTGREETNKQTKKVKFFLYFSVSSSSDVKSLPLSALLHKTPKTLHQTESSTKLFWFHLHMFTLVCVEPVGGQGIFFCVALPCFDILQRVFEPGGNLHIVNKCEQGEKVIGQPRRT